jgi:uncharacterized protein (TIGR03437 family)
MTVVCRSPSGLFWSVPKLCASGGWTIGGDGSASAELYDPSIGGFVATGNMTAPRYMQTATLLSSGQVLIAGGVSHATQVPIGAVLLSSAELYTPAVLVPAPILFSLSGDGTGQGAIWHVDGQIASPDNPAIAGEALATYTTGFADGAVIPPQVAIGGRLAEILFFGNAPGYPGFNQVNFRVPSGIAPGPGIAVLMSYIDRPSNEVTIGVR